MQTSAKPKSLPAQIKKIKVLTKEDHLILRDVKYLLNLKEPSVRQKLEEIVQKIKSQQ